MLENLVAIENFNYNGYNARNWSMVKEIYDPNVKFIMANTTEFIGIDNLLRQMKTGMTNEKVISIPINFGSGDWCATTYLMGSFGPKSWAMEHCALTKWFNGKIVEIHAFYDNAESQLQMDNLKCVD